VRKRQYILQEGDVCRYIAFVEKGLMRMYSIDSRGFKDSKIETTP
jgi:CRP-like cAMP-binding protein